MDQSGCSKSFRVTTKVVELTLPTANICVGQQFELAVGNVISTGSNLYSRCKEVQNILRDAQKKWIVVTADRPPSAASTMMARLSTKTSLSACLSICLSDSQGELETQKRHHEAKLITTKEEEKHKMDKMALELELKWTETLR